MILSPDFILLRFFFFISAVNRSFCSTCGLFNCFPICIQLFLVCFFLQNAFQLGDGFTNILWPTACMAGLGIARVSYKKWLKFFWPILVAGFIFSVAIVLYCVAVGFGPF